MIDFKKFCKLSVMVALAATPHSAVKNNHSKNFKNSVKSAQKNIKNKYNSYFNKLAEKESGGRYNVVNRYGYLGKYQMGEMALIQAGLYKKDRKNINNKWDGEWTDKAKEFKVYNKDDFLLNKEIQEYAVREYTKENWRLVKHFKLHKYIGEKKDGIMITHAGILAGTHLVGIGGLKNYLERDIITKDGNGVHITAYLNDLSGYDIPKNIKLSQAES